MGKYTAVFAAFLIIKHGSVTTIIAVISHGGDELLHIDEVRL